MSLQSSAAPGGLAWQSMLYQAANPVAVFDLRGHIIYVNPAVCDLLGYDTADLIGMTAAQLTHPDDPVMDAGFIRDMIASGFDKQQMDERAIRSDGTVVWVLSSYALIRDPSGEPQFILSQHQNITERRSAELRWRQTFTNAPIGMALIDITGQWLEVNDVLCEMLGYPRDELLAKHFTELVYPGDNPGHDALADLVSGRRTTLFMEKRYRHKAGHPIWVRARASAVPGADDKPAYFVVQYEGIGEREARDSHLAHMALHDPLTGLANRMLLMDRLELALAALPQRGGVLAVLLADLNGLKPINDKYGHATGDQLLIAAADRLLKAVRPGDTVARLGGDEFVVLARTPSRHEAEAFRDRVSQRLETDVVLPGHEIRLSASIGLATAHDEATTASDLLHAADLDMYARKPSGRR